MSVNRYNSTTGKLEIISGGTLYADAPIGSIQAYGGTTAPTGWLLCQGQAVSRTEYAELFTIIGTAFGAGDGSTTFNVPDLREATTKGVGLSSKTSVHYDSDGIALGEFVDDRIKRHNHQVYVRDAGHAHSLALTLGAFPAGDQFLVPYNAAPSGVVTDSASANIQVNSSPTFTGESNSTTDTGSTTNEVKAVGVNYIIKAKQVSIPVDFADSLVGYVGEEAVYNLYQWSDTRVATDPDTYKDFAVEQDGWYSIDYTLTQSGNDNNGFAIRDFDEQGETHTIGRAEIAGCTYYRSNIIIPLKAGTYRYHHRGGGSLNVYMNRRDFA